MSTKLIPIENKLPIILVRDNRVEIGFAVPHPSIPSPSSSSTYIYLSQSLFSITLARNIKYMYTVECALHEAAKERTGQLFAWSVDAPAVVVHVRVEFI